MRNPACLSPHSDTRGSARIFDCFGRAVTAAGVLPCAGGSFIACRPRLEAVRSVRPGVLRVAPGRIFGGAA